MLYCVKILVIYKYKTYIFSVEWNKLWNVEVSREHGQPVHWSMIVWLTYHIIRGTAIVFVAVDQIWPPRSRGCQQVFQSL